MREENLITFGLLLPLAAIWVVVGVGRGIALRSEVTRRSAVNAIRCATAGAVLQTLAMALAVIPVAVPPTI